jgi:LacI family transcriptional regulator
MDSKKNPTMKDVAKQAGVALGTVSKVINGIHVSEKNKLKVESAIKALNYEVNTYARGLKTQKSNLVALIIPNTLNPYFGAFTHYIERSLCKRGIRLLLCCSEGIEQKEMDYLSLAVNNKVDGIVALTYSDIGNCIGPGLPIVVLDRFFENHLIPRVASDNFAGGVLAIEKLLEFGCTHPVYIRFHSEKHGETDKRKDGYLHACDKYNIEPDYLDVLDCDDEMEVLKDFLNTHKKSDGTLTFDGVFAHTDYHGYLFKNILIRDGYRVPDDVQIIGFDGISKFGNYTSGLFISSICQPVDQLAEKCVEILLSPETPPSLTLLPVYYQYGGTTREDNG